VEEADPLRPATWSWFALNGEHERPLFAFPGIWQRWKGPVKKDGPNVEIDTYAFMTTEPNALTRAINHERMPVLLSGEDQFETWLSGSPAKAFALAQSFNPALMRIVQSGNNEGGFAGGLIGRLGRCEQCRAPRQDAMPRRQAFPNRPRHSSSP
jgi:putative SOS response-associated peptidase YedK